MRAKSVPSWLAAHNPSRLLHPCQKSHLKRRPMPRNFSQKLASQSRPKRISSNWSIFGALLNLLSIRYLENLNLFFPIIIIGTKHNQGLCHDIGLHVGNVELVVDRTGLVALAQAASEVVITCVNFIENSDLGKHLKSRKVQAGIWLSLTCTKDGIESVIFFFFFANEIRRRWTRRNH